MKISKKWKKSLEISFYTVVPKIMIIWYTVPKTWHVTDVIIFHFGHFLPFYPPNLSEKWNFQKNEKKPWDNIILHTCTKNHDHMLYCCWDIACYRCNCYFSFWAYFLPFFSPNSLKNQNFKKMKNTPGDIIILHMCTINYN